MAANVKRIYQENVSLKKQCENAKTEAQSSVQKAMEEKSKAVTRLREFEALVEKKYQSSEESQRALIEVQRQLVVLKVNEETLTRRYVAAAEGENQLQKEVHKLKSDIANLDTIARSTISRLGKSKKEIQEKVDVLQEELASSVPLSDFVRMEHKLNLYIAKNQILMEKQTSVTDFKNRQEALQVKEQEADRRAIQAELSQKECQINLSNIENAFNELKNSSDMKALAADAKLQSAKLQVEVDILKEKVRLAEKQVADVLKNESDVSLNFVKILFISLKMLDENTSISVGDAIPKCKGRKYKDPRGEYEDSSCL